MSDLTGRVALVTGASRGIGAAIAVRFAEHGADVALTYANSEQRAAEVVAQVEARGRRALAIRADSAEADEVVAAVDRTAEVFGGLDILVNNAGIFPAGPFEDFKLDDIDHALNIHARAAFVGSQAAVRYMESGGRIISVGSNLADRAPSGGLALYNLSKSALNGFTKALARELGPRGITVNLIQPGSTDTEMNPATGDAAEDQRRLTALGRYSTVDDVAAAAAYIAGDSGRSLTGAVLTLDAGANA